MRDETLTVTVDFGGTIAKGENFYRLFTTTDAGDEAVMLGALPVCRKAERP